MANINIGGRLHSTATGNVVAGADEIFDDSEQKKQSQINTEVNQSLGEIHEALTGKQDVITAVVSPTVTEDGGDPSVVTTFEAGELDLAFKNLKGDKGDTGEKGDKGDQGDSAIWDENEPHEKLTDLAHVLGSSTVKPMSQKGVTDAISGYVKMSFDDGDLSEKGIINNVVGEVIQVSESSSFNSYRHGIFPLSEGNTGRITTQAGTSILLAYCFADKDLKVLWVSSKVSVHDNEDFVAPEGAAYICVNYDTASSTVFSLLLNGVEQDIKDIKDALEKVDDIRDDVKDLQDVLAAQPAEYNINDLQVGNINNRYVGQAYTMGTLDTYRYLIIPCVKGQTVTINTSGGTKSSTNMRGLAFANANGIVIQTTDIGTVSGEFEAPENSTFCLVNYYVATGVPFSMEVSPAPSWMTELKNEVAQLREDVDEIIDQQVEESIPLYHGKDMFFIKDTPLDFYAQEVLFNNYPAYRGVYVNCARVLSRRSTNDFTLPVIYHADPTGKVYFDDGNVVDIYADDGKLYKDSWCVVHNISVHTTDLTAKQKSVKVMCIGSSTTEYGLPTYVKNYLATIGVQMTSLGHINDTLGTPAEGYAGWSCEMICGKSQGSGTYPQTGIPTGKVNPFMKLATAADKEDYPDYCFNFVEGSTGNRTSYKDASDKTQDFYIFDFGWYLETRGVQTPDVVFFLLGLNGTVDNYGIYMPWIVDRIMQACPDCKIGINVSQAVRLESAADEEVEEDLQKFDMLYDYVAQKNSEKLKVVSCHCYQTPYFGHGLAFSDGENTVTSKATTNDGWLHMYNSGYQQIAKAIGAFIAYCLPEN